MPGRLIGKQYPNTTTVTYTYETTTSRLKSVTDAASQVKTYSYARDDRLLGIAYTGAVNPTPDVGFTWDPYFPRLASRTDGAGTTQFTYVPVGSLGALQVQQEAGPFADSAITSAYDELGRLSQRTVQGTGAETFQHDAIGRLTGHGSDLGAFTLGYLGQTGQITSRQLASSTLATTWSYLTNTNDRRLSGINNVGLTSGHFSTFAYTTSPENFIGAITETSDASAVYPPAGSQTATYAYATSRRTVTALKSSRSCMSVAASGYSYPLVEPKKSQQYDSSLGARTDDDFDMSPYPSYN